MSPLQPANCLESRDGRPNYQMPSLSPTVSTARSSRHSFLASRSAWQSPQRFLSLQQPTHMGWKRPRLHRRRALPAKPPLLPGIWRTRNQRNWSGVCARGKSHVPFCRRAGIDCGQEMQALRESMTWTLRACAEEAKRASRAARSGRTESKAFRFIRTMERVMTKTIEIFGVESVELTRREDSGQPTGAPR